MLELGSSVGGSGGQSGPGLLVGLPRHGTRSLEAELRNVGALAQSLVGAVGLAEVGIAAHHVEDVVDDLEQDAELGGELAVASGLATAQQQDALDRRPDEPAGLELVQLAQARGTGGDV